MTTSQYELGKLRTSAFYVDPNPDIALDGAPEVVMDVNAVNSGIANLLGTQIGGAGPIFLPTYGSLLLELLGEPVDDVTAGLIRVAIFQALSTWETRIDLDLQACKVTPDNSIPGYAITLVYSMAGTELSGKATFTVTAQ